MLPTWSIVSSRAWKAQVPYLARRMRVVLFDPRGNGLSDRPLDPAAYRYEEHVADALAVLDAAEVARAAVVGWSLGGRYALVLAAEHPERVDRAVFVAPTVGFATLPRDIDFEADWPDDEGWHRYNRRSWLRDYRGFLEYFFSQVYSEPHSTKQIDDSVAFGLDTSAETLVATMVGGTSPDNRALARRVRCPVLVMHGDDDHIVAYENGVELAEETGGALVTFSGSGHGPPLRDPVAANLILGEFLAPSSPEPSYVRAPVRTRRALFVSSPIGLGHARRDLALARELRRLVPGLEIDWLAQPPVTRLLESTEERIHPASAELAGENAHISAEAGEHELHVFEAFRRMDEILLANFMLFDEVAAEGRYDMWIGDEAWELDHYLHENPERKRAAYVWLTDFVGWVPLPENGEREPLLTADYNAEMLEHVARYPRVRDRALFFGDKEDVAPVGFGPGLPAVRDWMAEHYDFVGYETGSRSGRDRPRRRPRAARLGAGRAGVRRLGGRLGSRGTAAGQGRGRGRTPPAARARDANGVRLRPVDRPGLARARRGSGAPGSRRRHAGAARGRRRGPGPGRPGHHHGARRRGPPVRGRAAGPPLRAAGPRPPPPRPPWEPRAGSSIATRGPRRWPLQWPRPCARPCATRR